MNQVQTQARLGGHYGTTLSYIDAFIYKGLLGNSNKVLE